MGSQHSRWLPINIYTFLLQYSQNSYIEFYPWRFEYKDQQLWLLCVPDKMELNLDHNHKPHWKYVFTKFSLTNKKYNQWRKLKHISFSGQSPGRDHQCQLQLIPMNQHLIIKITIIGFGCEKDGGAFVLNRVN